MSAIDHAHSHLEKLISRASTLRLSDANEATTRLQIIDDMLRLVLGWTIEDLSVEERVSEDKNTTFADYILRTANTSIIVEAKKIGESFSLPSNHTNLKLGGVLSQGAVGEATRQVRDYCRKKAVPFAIATNGSEWIIFPAVRTDGVSFEETYAKAFRSLEDIKTRFVEFWELVSRERVMEGNLENEFLAQKESQTRRCLRDTIEDSNFRMGRNSFFEYIEPAVNYALTDEAILKNPEALEYCYVKTNERLKFDGRIRMYIQDVKPSLGHVSQRIKDRNANNPLQKAITKSGELKVQKFIVLLGPVGAGKTTFLNYVRNVSGAAEINNKILWLTLDFKKATRQDNVRSFIYSELRDAIEEDKQFDLGDWDITISRAYEEKINNLKRGPLKPLVKSNPDQFDIRISEMVNKEREEYEPYVNQVLSYSSDLRPTYIIFDNVDQIEDLAFQASIFIEAQAVARKTGSNTIICLRESTFQKHRNDPIFDAFQFESFYIEAPTIPPVISRRLSYARKILGTHAIDLTTETGAKIRVDDVGKFFEIVAKSVLNERNGHLLEALAGGDIRRGLSLLREFLSSPHTNADRAIASYLIDGDYEFPKHEVFKSAVLGNKKFYDDSTSLLPNIYDSKLGSRDLQQLRLRITAMLVTGASEAAFDGKPIEEIISNLHRRAISEVDVLSVLNRLHQTRLIRTPDGLPPTPTSKIFPTRLAGYIVRNLAYEFAYSEFCSLDTVIFDEDSWQGLLELNTKVQLAKESPEKVEYRIQRTKLFFEYIAKLEDSWIVESKRRGLDPEWLEPVIKSHIIPNSVSYFDRVRESSKRKPNIRSYRS
ncbi:hypothetical protein ACNH6C_09275 [Bdellovibrio bacteriovorus]|uniref:hypothetical protein n=1 Tax=Bdellovibrio bacteriovorus TaxID=959 RepID=UPI003A80A00B